MKSTAIALLPLLALLGNVASQAQPAIEARRYRTSDGIEIITSRATPPPAAASSVAGRSIAIGAQPALATGQLAAVAASLPRVPDTLQRQRDEVRAQVLWGELSQATQSWQAAQRALQSPRASAELSAVQRQALAADVERHAQDIRALHAELRRLRPELQRQPRPS